MYTDRLQDQVAALSRVAPPDLARPPGGTSLAGSPCEANDLRTRRGGDDLSRPHPDALPGPAVRYPTALSDRLCAGAWLSRTGASPSRAHTRRLLRCRGNGDIPLGG